MEAYNYSINNNNKGDIMDRLKHLFGKKSFSKKKGITPVIAIVLLLMMTVAAAGMAYVWIMSVQEDVTAVADEQLDDMKTSTSIRLDFEAVNNNTDTTDVRSGNMTITIRNSGKYGFSEEDLGQFVVYTDRTEDLNATGDIAKCVDTATGSIGNLNVLGGLCTIKTDTAFPKATGSANGVLIEITTAFKDVKFSYTCAIDRSGRQYC